MTQEETQFLISLLDQISIKVTAPDADKTIELTKSILAKLVGSEMPKMPEIPNIPTNND